MELKEFVKNALIGITQGVKEANKELSGKNPTDADDKAFLLAYSGGDKPLGRHIEFDMAVTTKSDFHVKGGASTKILVAEMKVGFFGKKENENVSRVRFAVLVKEHQG